MHSEFGRLFIVTFITFIYKMNPFILSAACIFCFMCFMFIVALVKKDNSIVDIAWGLGFILVAFTTFYVYSDGRLHQKLATFITLVWGLRLSLYLLIRNWGKPEDFRYAQWRKEWGETLVIRSFLQVFMLQGLIMFINTLPLVIINSTPHVHKHLTWLYPVGSAVGLIGFFFESVGDLQMYMYKAIRINTG